MKSKKKILLNFISIEQHPFIGWTERIIQLTNQFDCTILCSRNVRKLIIQKNLIHNIKFHLFEETNDKDQFIQKESKMGFLWIALKRNLLALKYVKYALNFDATYSFTSVLDLIILNFITKMLNRDIKWITYLDNTVPFTDKGNKLIKFLAWVFFRLSLFMIRQSDLVFVISRDLFKFLSNSGFSTSKLSLTSNGIEYSSIHKAKPQDLYKSDFVYMGRINEAKGVFDLIKLLNLFKVEGNIYNLSIVGAGDKETESLLGKEIANRGLQSQVKIYGWVEGIKKYEIIKSSKIFISLSSSESFGVALLEGVSCGLPAVAYRLKTYLTVYKNNEVQFAKLNDLLMVKQLIEKILKDGSPANINGINLGEKYLWPNLAKSDCQRIQKCFD